MKNSIFIFLFVNCFLLFGICQAQVTQQWVARYNGTNNYDEAFSIAVDGSGNVYVTGGSRGNGPGYDYATIKYNSSGVQQWEARYNGQGNAEDVANSIAVDGSGNVYITGYSWGIEFDYATIKYNSSGVQQWIQRYNGTGNEPDYATSLAVDGSGNVYVTGYSWGSGTNFDYATIKYNSAGIQQWVERYNSPGNLQDKAWSLAVDGSGNVFVTGGCAQYYATIKYNSSGDSLWVRRYNGPGNAEDVARSIAVDGSGNVYVTGGSGGSGTFEDYATIKYNSAGVQQWAARYNGPGNNFDAAYSIALDGLGNVYVTGNSWGGATDEDYATLKYNSSGVQQWASRYNGPGNDLDAARSLAVDSSGNVYVTGVSRSGSTYGTEDYATIKYNSSGDPLWVQRYTGPGNFRDDARSIAVDGSGNVYVTGWSYGGSGTFDDYTTIKYSQLVGIQPVSNEIPNSFSLSQNCPNPFNPTTKIRFYIPLSRGVDAEGRRGVFTKLIVFDVLGREIATLVNKNLDLGTYEADWDASNYPSGVYYYKLTSGDYSETKKMILIK